ncbi:acetylornithine aminotransferase [bacterium BMS3Abin07]|nr:acetylornithine aminotransferase [bacterium BMS3Abin07]GBE31812.1 acetylornithine aminotransferase [bacterium BMS3Bbin05]HDL19960.1 acetylornithine transaminase [Nitrospirota bacterium]HDO21886.1 acetylornithine transaminase [Nitrospirota bacterium]HDZ87776.1 acetylornithine transaminase [Nitrospirota bacterium]
MDPKRLIEDGNHYLFHTYNRYPIVLRKGRGMKVWDYEGREYTDFLSGIAVNVLGHCHPRVVIAIQKQAQRLIHVSNLYHIAPQIRLAKLLVNKSFADRVFFCNSGAEANEAAIKLARKYSLMQHGDHRHEIITALNSFHGRTITTLSATGQTQFRKGFEPLTPGFRHVEFNNIEDLKSAINSNTCAVMLEPIQGESGIRVATKEYLVEVRRLCTEHDILLILDEVQTGIGHTGKLFAYEHYGIIPDIITLGKGLGGGAPIGAMMAKEKMKNVFGTGSHGSTFGGNPLVCAAAIATIETILEDGILLSECERLGEYMRGRLNELKKEFPDIILNIRGKGLLIGMEINRECSQIVTECMKRGYLINCTAGNTIRFIPPLIVTQNDIDNLTDVLDDVLGRFV